MPEPSLSVATSVKVVIDEGKTKKRPQGDEEEVCLSGAHRGSGRWSASEHGHVSANGRPTVPHPAGSQRALGSYPLGSLRQESVVEQNPPIP